LDSYKGSGKNVKINAINIKKTPNIQFSESSTNQIENNNISKTENFQINKDKAPATSIVETNQPIRQIYKPNMIQPNAYIPNVPQIGITNSNPDTKTKVEKQLSVEGNVKHVTNGDGSNYSEVNFGAKFGIKF
jgi:hypothetical protein